MDKKRIKASLTLFAALALSAGLLVAAGCGGEAGLAETVPCSEPSAFTFDTELISVNAGGSSMLELKELPADAYWTATYRDPRPMSGPEYHVVDFCPDGSVVAVGDCANFADWSSEVILGKYDSNGQSLPGWPKFYKGPGSHWNEGQDVVVDDDGSIVVAGYADIWRFDAEGNILPGWPQDFLGDRSISTAVIIDRSGDIVACGSSDAEGYSQFTLKKYSRDGTVVEGWPKSFAVTGNEESFAYDLILDYDGNLVVAGYAETAGVRVAMLHKLDAEGNALPGWPKTWSSGGGGYDEYFSVSQEEDGNYCVVGITSANWESGKLLVTKYDVDGEQLTTSGWPQIYDRDGVRDASPPDSWSGGADGAGGIAAAAACQPGNNVTTVRYTAEASMASGFPRVIEKDGYYEVTRSCCADDMGNIYTVGYWEVDDGTHADYTTFIAKYPPGAYSTGRPSAIIKQGICYTSLTGFSETPGPDNEGSMAYQLSPDGEEWFYFNGSEWDDAKTKLDANDAGEINEHIAEYAEKVGPGTLYIKAFLVSDGSRKVQLESITINYEG
jgi:hypothetical protein